MIEAFKCVLLFRRIKGIEPSILYFTSIGYWLIIVFNFIDLIQWISQKF